MINQMQRDVIRKYFYGTRGPVILATLGTTAAFLIGAISREQSLMIGLPVVCLIVAGIWSMVAKLAPNPGAEQEYDKQIEKDIADLSERALEKLGLVSEQVSLIEPLKVKGPYYGYKEYDLDIRKSAIVQLLVLALKVLFFVVYLPYLGIKAIINRKSYRPSLIFKSGVDGEVRYSMVKTNIFVFSENQIYVYTCAYDICSGEIFEEKTAEYFYQDVDCVITGSKVEKVISKKKVVNKYFEYFEVIVTSGTSTNAYADAKVSILNTQVKGMRELIRSKKEEITL